MGHLLLKNYLACFFFSFMLLHNTSFAQLRVSWDKDFGGSVWEELNTSAETPDGGYILAGFSSSEANDGNVTDPNQGVGDYWVVKTDENGNKQWDARFGGDGLDRCNIVKVTSDGGFILGGSSDSGLSGNKSEASRGLEDYWVVKTDANGVMEWEKTIGGDNLDLMFSLTQTSDGGFILGGHSFSGISGDKTEANIGNLDFWIVKLNALGQIEWDKTIGGLEEERLNDIQIAADGNILVGGGSRSDISGDVTLPLVGVKDYWFLKISSVNGDIIWERRYGGTDEDEIQNFVQTSDGGYLLAGGSRSGISGDKSQMSRGIVDMWIVKIDGAGTIEWDATFGGESIENCYSAKQNAVGYYILGGFSGSGIGIDKSEPNIGGWDYWVVYVDEFGNKVWDKTLGGDSNDVMFGIFESSEGGYIMAGSSTSDVSGDKTDPTKGLNDFWMIKTVCDVTFDIPDMTVCDGQPIILDAYNGSECVQCVYDWSDIGAGDSIRTIVPASDLMMSLTLTDGVGCRREDSFEIEIIPAPTVDLGNDLSFCDGNIATLNAQNPGLDYEWSTGEQTQMIDIDTTGTYIVTVTIGNGCTAVDSMHLEVFPTPFVDLGVNIGGCSNTNIPFDAGNPGSTYLWSTGEMDRTISFDPTSASIVSVTVTNANNCSASDMVEITDLVDSPSTSNVTSTCNLTNSAYTVSFDIINGIASTYMVNSVNSSGTLTGNQFVSDPIPKDQSVTFNISDASGCPSSELVANFGCPCMSDAGQMDLTPFDICGDSDFMVTLSSSNLEADDLLEYVLHDGDANTLGNILLAQNNPTFSYQPAFNYETTYYIAARVANNDGSGNLLEQDCCLSVSEGVAVTFFEKPEVQIDPLNGTALSCNQQSALLSGITSQPIEGLDYVWSSPNGGVISGINTTPIVEVGIAGIYQLVVSLPNSDCRDTATVEITALSFDLPTVNLELLPTLTCRDSVIMIDVGNTSIGPEFSYLWEGGNINGANILSPSISETGTYSLTVTNTTTGCTMSNSTEVIENKTSPIIEGGDSSFLSCDEMNTTLQATILSMGNNFTIDWNTDDGNIVSGNSTLMPLVNQEGTYTLLVTDEENGCTSTDEVQVNAYEIPEAVIVANSGTEINCVTSTLVLSGTSSQASGILEFMWTASNGGNIVSNNDLPEIEINAAGMYTLEVSLPNNPCTHSTTIEVTASADLPQAIIEDGAVLTCEIDKVILNTNGTSAGSEFTYLWEGGDIDGLMSLSPEITDPGIYTLTVTNTTNNCTSVASTEVVAMIDAPIIDAGDLSFLSCSESRAQLNGTLISALTNVSFLWSTLDGNIVSGSNTVNPVVDRSGTYIFEVRNEDNGCSATDEVIVSADPNGPNDAIFSLTNPNCFGFTDGTIMVDSVVGGVGPYLLSIDGSPFFGVTQFGNLTSGNHDLVIQDAEGCEWATSVELAQPIPLQIFLEETQTIALGDSLELDVVVSGLVDTFFWAMDSTLSCLNCLEPVVDPIENTSYQLTVIDVNDCQTNAQVNINVTKERLVYIPSVFSPNADGVNDYFTLYGGQGTTEINYLRIFNRWGAVVFENENFALSEESSGWDGDFDGDFLNSGVYVFVAEILFADGETIEYSGEVTLIR